MGLHANKDFSEKNVKNQEKRLKNLTSDIDLMRAHLWSKVIGTRDRIRMALKNVDQIKETKEHVKKIFSETQKSISENLKDFKQSHSEEEISELINQLADRSETLHPERSPLYDLEDDWDEKDIKDLAKDLDRGWNELKEQFEHP